MRDRTRCRAENPVTESVFPEAVSLHPSHPSTGISEWVKQCRPGRGGLESWPLRLLRFALVSLALLLSVSLGVRTFYTFVFVAPFTKGEVLMGPHCSVSPSPMPSIATARRCRRRRERRVPSSTFGRAGWCASATKARITPGPSSTARVTGRLRYRDGPSLRAPARCEDRLRAGRVDRGRRAAGQHRRLRHLHGALAGR